MKIPEKKTSAKGPSGEDQGQSTPPEASPGSGLGRTTAPAPLTAQSSQCCMWMRRRPRCHPQGPGDHNGCDHHLSDGGAPSARTRLQERAAPPSRARGRRNHRCRGTNPGQEAGRVAVRALGEGLRCPSLTPCRPHPHCSHWARPHLRAFAPAPPTTRTLPLRSSLPLPDPTRRPFFRNALPGPGPSPLALTAITQSQPS